MAAIKAACPWMQTPALIAAPMLNASTPRLATKVSKAGGLGFIAGGSDPVKLDEMLQEAGALLKDSRGTPVRIGVGFQLFNTSLDSIANVIARHDPVAVWLFAAEKPDEYRNWANKLRSLSKDIQIWVQAGSAEEAMQAVSLANPEVLVLQGNDAGGHGRRQSASVMTLVPEVVDMLKHAGRADVSILAAGGIVDGRGIAASVALGACGAAIGSRFLASEESAIPEGWKRVIVGARDGGIATSRSTISDRLKGTTNWPQHYDGRAIRNQGHIDDEAGMPDVENIERYKEELEKGDEAWGSHGRMVAYAGTGVGIIQQVQPAEQIVREIFEESRKILQMAARL